MLSQGNYDTVNMYYSRQNENLYLSNERNGKIYFYFSNKYSFIRYFVDN